MAEYTVTIEADSDLGGARTTIRIDAATGAPRVVEYSVTAGAGGDINTLHPQPRMDALIAALTGAPAPARPAEAPARPAEAATPAAEAATPPVAGPPSAAAGEPSPAKAATRTRRRPRPEPAAAEPAERVYRRMPDPAELVGAYHEAASVVQLAEQYGVPRHTMNGWLARLRQQGLIERR